MKGSVQIFISDDTFFLIKIREHQGDPNGKIGILTFDSLLLLSLQSIFADVSGAAV